MGAPETSDVRHGAQYQAATDVTLCAGSHAFGSVLAWLFTYFPQEFDICDSDCRRQLCRHGAVG